MIKIIENYIAEWNDMFSYPKPIEVSKEPLYVRVKIKAQIIGSKLIPEEYGYLVTISNNQALIALFDLYQIYSKAPYRQVNIDQIEVY